MSFWNVIKGLINSTDVREARLDSSTHTMQTIEYAHHEVHGGSHFTFCASDGDLDSGQVIEFILTTPDTTKWAHLIASAYGALHTKLEIYEDTTHTTGAAQTAYNNNRNSGTAATITINASNDDNADGTLIFSSEWGIDTGAGTNKKSGGGESRGDSEWVLKQNTKYLVRVESQTADNVADLCLSWYEHTDKD